ncbi:MAG: hypothetical protein GY953_20715 [bacterium]|nr:hypothetical protein [bacterium]
MRDEQTGSTAKFDEILEEIRQLGQESDRRLNALIKAVGGIDQERPQ